jgi:hypothetical protein
MIRAVRILFIAVVLTLVSLDLSAPVLAAGSGGTIQGTVFDPVGAVVPNATATIQNALTGYRQTTTTDARGHFSLYNVPPNPYRLEVAAPGFSPYQQDLILSGENIAKGLRPFEESGVRSQKRNCAGCGRQCAGR